MIGRFQKIFSKGGAKAMVEFDKTPHLKPHVVCIPAPFQSHVKAMAEFAKLLHHRGFHISFVNTSTNHAKLLHARGTNALDGLPDFQFHSIPDGLSESECNDMNALVLGIRDNLLDPFMDLLSSLNDDAASSDNLPRVSCIFADGFMPFTTAAADNIGVPLVNFFSINACSLMVFKHFRALREKGVLHIQDEGSNFMPDEYLDQMVDWIPGTNNLRLKDLPFRISDTSPFSSLFEYSMEAVENACKSSAIVIHTFEALEHETLEALSSMFPPIYAIGPIPLLVNEIPSNDPLKSIGHNFLKEEIECLQWLNTKESNSVLYVNFGSLTILTHEQLTEFAWGLANSKQQFLWVIRPDLVIGEFAIVPPEFIQDTKERSMVSGWCPQEKVLNHPSVKGFLTHCGWNSIIESICAGVPMICWPFMGDQTINCRYSCNEWGIGIDIRGNVTRKNVEIAVRELMNEEKGKELREKVMKWKHKAEEAIVSNGSSSVNFNMLINEILLSK